MIDWQIMRLPLKSTKQVAKWCNSSTLWLYSYYNPFMSWLACVNEGNWSIEVRSL